MCRLWKRSLCLLLVLGCLCGVIPAGQAAIPELPDALFLTQEGSGTCTLCSAAMMIRSCLYIHGNEAWSTVTQEGLRSTAWLKNVGLKWNFKYTAESCVVQVAYQGLKGITVQELKNVLDQHPEGVVLYCKSVPHAVFLLGYEGDTFYCAETVKGYSGEIITLEESWLGKKCGSQAEVLEQVSSYWYVSSYEGLTVEPCGCQASLAGIYRVSTKSADLMIRGGHGTGYTVVGRIPTGTEITVTMASGNGEDDWAHVTYNGVSGYASMKYLTKIGELHRYESVVRQPTCTEPGCTVHTCVDCGHSYEDTPVAPLGHRYGDWSADETLGKEFRACERCDDRQWRDVAVMGTITGNRLRIRANPGTAYEVKGYLMRGDRVEILEQKTVGSMTWGRIDRGWISMTYVVLDQPVTEEPPTTEPPTTEPPTTEPPTTEPPTTEPPTTEPPTTEPPTTEPPTTEPPTTEPPTTEPEPEGIPGTVTASVLRIRSGPGTGYKTLDRLCRGDRVEILEQKTVDGMTWGKIARGWISLDYVELDKPAENEPEQSRMVTVTTNVLRVRSEAGVGHKIVGYLYRGAKVEITEEKTIDGMAWGKTEQGWISLQYTK